jgi:spore germination cell wall hydrolase CwlJ-like protein
MTENKSVRLFTYTLVLVLGFIITNTSNHNASNIGTEPIDEVTKVIKKVDPKQLACLAKNIFYEAGGEPIIGQAAVARVVLNRISYGFGSTPCSVIYQTSTIKKETDEGETEHVKLCQFHWVCENKGEPNKNSQRYLQAKSVAYEVLAHDAYNDVVSTSMIYFHNTSINPSLQYNEVKKIGNHIFYSKSNKKKAKQLKYTRES